MHISNDWNEIFEKEFQKKYFAELQSFLDHEKKQGHLIYPDENKIFAAFEKTSLKNISVVILGQDPYHGKNQAHGLSFSVEKNMSIPPSLKNIYKEILLEYPQEHTNKKFTHGNLDSWASQGVFLLNATLTVRADKAGSHQQKGWETFTDTIIKCISEKKSSVVFMLWGAYAQKKKSLINTDKHVVLTAPHPSPLSAYRGFFGCNHFLQANYHLKKWNKKEIDWGKE